MIAKYVVMEGFDYNWFFNMEDIKIPDSDLAKILPLSKEYSSILWDKHISKTDRHLCLIDKSEWPFLMDKIDYNWIPDWDKNKFDALSEMLRDKVSLSDEDTILFFWSRKYSVETTWGIFLKYWINFLFEDEGPILVSAENNTALRFSATGEVFIGERKELAEI